MLHLFLELTTLAFFALTALHATKQHGRFGLLFVSSLLALGFVRENYVTLERLLYGYADLHLELGAAPLIGAIIWPYSIYVACCFAERLTGESLERACAKPAFLGLIALFMMSLVGFYEPLLDRVGMARWQDGTLATAGAPWIAFIGYPTLAVGSTAVSGALIRRWHTGVIGAGRLALWLVPALVGVALLHAWGLQALKNSLDW